MEKFSTLQTEIFVFVLLTSEVRTGGKWIQIYCICCDVSDEREINYYVDIP